MCKIQNKNNRKIKKTKPSKTNSNKKYTTLIHTETT